jgi:hypothetical protein
VDVAADVTGMKVINVAQYLILLTYVSLYSEYGCAGLWFQSYWVLADFQIWFQLQLWINYARLIKFTPKLFLQIAQFLLLFHADF